MISVIVPTYNERENIPIIIYLLNQLPLPIQIVVVDDKSPDGTAEAVKQCQPHSKAAVTLIQRQGKLGLGSAYVTAVSHCKGQFIIIMDADLSHLPFYIEEFVKRQKQTDADIVTGSRYTAGGGVQGWPVTRKIISRVANFVTNQLFATDFTDLTGSFRLYRASVLQKLILEVKSVGYAFQTEILLRASRSGLRIEQVPIIFVDRIYGDSKLGTGEMTKYLKCLWNLLWDI